MGQKRRFECASVVSAIAPIVPNRCIVAAHGETGEAEEVDEPTRMGRRQRQIQPPSAPAAVSVTDRRNTRQRARRPMIRSATLHTASIAPTISCLPTTTSSSRHSSCAVTHGSTRAGSACLRTPNSDKPASVGSGSAGNGIGKRLAVSERRGAAKRSGRSFQSEANRTVSA